ncbi:MAG: thrombospondin type 3 repeat-containing protein [Thermoleophilaceae bacterium]
MDSPTGPRRVRIAGLATALVIAALALVVPTASASPILCPDGTGNGTLTLIDSGNNLWDLDSQAEAVDGGRDAFDNFGYLFVNNSGSAYDGSDSTYPYQCDLQANGRQIAFPEVGSPNGGIQWSRKVYVPATGTAFARWVDFLHNTTAAPIVLPTMRFGDGLGSDAQTKLEGDSDGDKAVKNPNDDRWTTTSDGFTAADHDPAVGEIWDGTVPGAADTADHIFNNSTGTVLWAPPNDNPVATYDSVTVPAGGTIAYMHILTQRLVLAELNPDAATLASGNGGEVFKGLTLDELAQIQNWNTTDADGDGRANAADNCPTDANADQADLDKDGAGDVCDDDIDGDGVSNADEATRGTDPKKADTDGDGKSDKVDVCPVTSGSGSDGCPPFNSLPAPPVVTPPDKTPPATTVGASRKLKRKAFLSGFTVKVGCDERCSVVAQVNAAARSARISKAYNLLLGSKSLAAGTGKRSLKLKPNKKLVGAARKFSVQLTVTTTDAAGNRTVKRVLIKIA